MTAPPNPYARISDDAMHEVTHLTAYALDIVQLGTDPARRMEMVDASRRLLTHPLAPRLLAPTLCLLAFAAEQLAQATDRHPAEVVAEWRQFMSEVLDILDTLRQDGGAA